MSLKPDVFDFTSYSDAGKGPKNDSRSHTYCFVEASHHVTAFYRKHNDMLCYKTKNIKEMNHTSRNENNLGGGANKIFK